MGGDRGQCVEGTDKLNRLDPPEDVNRELDLYHPRGAPRATAPSVQGMTENLGDRGTGRDTQIGRDPKTQRDRDQERQGETGDQETQTGTGSECVRGVWTKPHGEMGPRDKQGRRVPQRGGATVGQEWRQETREREARLHCLTGR